jgi:hypothetical protein
MSDSICVENTSSRGTAGAKGKLTGSFAKYCIFPSQGAGEPQNPLQQCVFPPPDTNPPPVFSIRNARLEAHTYNPSSSGGRGWQFEACPQVQTPVLQRNKTKQNKTKQNKTAPGTPQDSTIRKAPSTLVMAIHAIHSVCSTHSVKDLLFHTHTR